MICDKKSLMNFQILRTSGILLLNPKAAGAGLNITAANHVIHYNPEWNPAIEDQASARSHRLGQKIQFVSIDYYILIHLRKSWMRDYQKKRASW